MALALTSWILTDGKAGDEQPCLGVAEALGLSPELRRVAPRAPFAWAMPFGPIDPRERPSAPGSPLAPPFPDIAIASGRRSVPYLRAVKRASEGRTFTVYLKDPRTGAGAADFIWSPSYDRLRGENVLTTLTSPHRLSQERLAEARARPDARLDPLPRPLVAVLVGGDSRHHRFTDGDIARFLADLSRLTERGAGLMISPSRRTPPALRQGLAALAARAGGFFWDGTGANPYLPMLARAEAVVVTADSFNMVGEATATGVPVLVFEPSGGHPKLAAFLEGLKKSGAVHTFHGTMAGERYPPIDATPIIAREIEKRLTQYRHGLGL